MVHAQKYVARTLEGLGTNRASTAWGFVAASVALLLNGCGGGGGSAAVPGPTSTTAAASCTTAENIQAHQRQPLSLNSSAPTSTTYTITSNPSNLPVQIDGSSVGLTPQTFVPSFQTSVHTVVITSGANSVQYCVSQNASPARTIFYNATADTIGSLSNVSTSSVSRRSTANSAASFVRTLKARAVTKVHRAVYADDRLVVNYHRASVSASSRSVSAIEQQAGVRTAENLGPLNTSILSRVVHFSPGQNLDQARQKLLQDPTVASVEKVQLRYPLAVTPVTPNDPDFTGDDLTQWYLYQIQAPYGWGITTGSSAVHIAVVDTGYDTHASELANKVSFSESIINGTVDTSSTAAQDTDGHGTNVSGIAAAQTNNNVGVAGVGYNVMLQEYRIFTPVTVSNGVAQNGSAATSDEAMAIYAAVSNGAKVISLSLGGDPSAGIDATEYNAVEYAISKGVVVVAAAGNEQQNLLDDPASYPGVIAVGASALDDSTASQVRSSATEYVASYSNSGPGLALVAPGGDPSSDNDADPLHWITNLSTTTPGDPSEMCSDPTVCLSRFAGTSQATPQVAAAAALLFSLNSGLSPSQIRTILMNNADDINDTRQGAGRLNIARALSAVGGTAFSVPAYSNFVAFAYTTGGSATPNIIDVTYPHGVPVASSGSFRVSDIPSTATTYRIAVWADTNGDGIIDSGDFIGVSDMCSAGATCPSVARLTASAVTTGYTLP